MTQETPNDVELRRGLAASINEREAPREHLEAKWGQVWSTDELTRDFDVHGFLAPFVLVTRKRDKMPGTLTFQHYPRFYFDFTPNAAASEDVEGMGL